MRLLLFSSFLLFCILNVSLAEVTTTVPPTSTNSEPSGPTISSTTEEIIDYEAAMEKQQKKLQEEERKAMEEFKAMHKQCFNGDERSPVDLKLEDALPIYVPDLEFVNYDTIGEVWHRDNNQTESLTGFNDWEFPPFIRGGTLEGDYFLWEFQQNYAPSLGHRINGAFYDFEAQFIHVKRGMTIEDARGVPGAISIVAVEFKTIRQNWSSSDSHLKIFPKEQFGDFKEWRTPRPLIPKDTTHFFTYNGSFNQQPCYTGVIWNVLTEPVIFIDSQNNFFSRSRSLSESYRLEVPSIGNRTVLFNYGENRKPEDEGVPVLSLLIAVFGFTAIAVIFIRKCEPLWIVQQYLGQQWIRHARTNITEWKQSPIRHMDTFETV